VVSIQDEPRRDAFLNDVAESVGLPLLRVRARRYYPLPLVRYLLAQHLSDLPATEKTPDNGDSHTNGTTCPVSGRRVGIEPSPRWHDQPPRETHAADDDRSAVQRES